MEQNMEQTHFDNLVKMVSQLKLVRGTDAPFTMEFYNRDTAHATITDLMNPFECMTPACVIGHCIILDPVLFQTCLMDAVYANRHIAHDQFKIRVIAFLSWSEKFTGIKRDNMAWHWCFGKIWTHDKVYNTVTHAIERLEAYLTGDWEHMKLYDEMIYALSQGRWLHG